MKPVRVILQLFWIVSIVFLGGSCVPIQKNSDDAEALSKTIVARFEGPGCPDACTYMFFDLPPDWTLYADGKLLISKLADHGWMIEETIIPHTEVCRLLGQIANDGFFKLDLAPYETEVRNVQPRGFTLLDTISVQGQQYRSIGIDTFLLSRLPAEVNNRLALTPWFTVKQRLDLLAAGRNTQTYHPDRVVIWASRNQQQNHAMAYLTEAPNEGSLSPMLAQRILDEVPFGSEGYVVLTGEMAIETSALFGNISLTHKAVQHDGEIIYLSYRALSPDEDSHVGSFGENDKIEPMNLLPSNFCQ